MRGFVRAVYYTFNYRSERVSLPAGRTGTSRRDCPGAVTVSPAVTGRDCGVTLTPFHPVSADFGVRFVADHTLLPPTITLLH